MLTWMRPGRQRCADDRGLVLRVVWHELSATAKFCNECGAPSTGSPRSAEYKQVTVLFADVVHSMDIAAAVGRGAAARDHGRAGRPLAAVVQRYGGTVDKFTGDGIMAVFGAPVALEDHAFRACLAALGSRTDGRAWPSRSKRRDGIDLRLRVGLNSGQVIAGEIGSGAWVTPRSASRSGWPSGWSRSRRRAG